MDTGTSGNKIENEAAVVADEQARSGQNATGAEAWDEIIFRANPWLSELNILKLPGASLTDINEKDDDLISARKAASLARFEAGRESWNAWAAEMQSAKAAIDGAGKWQMTKDRRGNPLPKTAETKAWLSTASVDFRGLHFANSVDFRQFIFPGNADFRKVPVTRTNDQPQRCVFKGLAMFNEAVFKGSAWFEMAVFEGSAWFSKAVFEGSAWFNEAVLEDLTFFNKAVFEGSAWFNEAVFEGSARFDEVVFEGSARFDEVVFKGSVWFNEAVFKGATWFVQAGFEGYSSFASVAFEGVSSFSAINALSAFDMSGASFLKLPYFIQAHFAESPEFNNLHLPWGLIEPGGFWRSIIGYVKPDVPSKYRALKRLAIQGHDHEREQIFFAGELRSQRSLHGFDGEPLRDVMQEEAEREKLKLAQVAAEATNNNSIKREPVRSRTVKTAGALEHEAARAALWKRALKNTKPRRNIWRLFMPSWYFNIFYDLISDFGRSLWRPFGFWLLTVLVMCWLHLSSHFARANESNFLKKIAPYDDGLLAWLIGRVKDLTAGAELTSLKGISGIECSPGFAAIHLAFKKGLLVLGWDASEKFSQDYACLYGFNKSFEELKTGELVPVIPDHIVLWQMGQSIASAILIFLFLLALRNHFRIK